MRYEVFHLNKPKIELDIERLTQILDDKLEEMDEIFNTYEESFKYFGLKKLEEIQKEIIDICYFLFEKDCEKSLHCEENGKHIDKIGDAIFIIFKYKRKHNL